MDAQRAGRRGGRSRSSAKRAAARRNGSRGGRPRKVVALLRRMDAMRDKLRGRLPEVDPSDLDLIIERLCRLPGDRGRFFIRPRKDGGYGF